MSIAAQGRRDVRNSPFAPLQIALDGMTDERLPFLRPQRRARAVLLNEIDEVWVRLGDQFRVTAPQLEIELPGRLASPRHGDGRETADHVPLVVAVIVERYLRPVDVGEETLDVGVPVADETFFRALDAFQQAVCEFDGWHGSLPGECSENAVVVLHQRASS